MSSKGIEPKLSAIGQFNSTEEIYIEKTRNNRLIDGQTTSLPRMVAV